MNVAKLNERISGDKDAIETLLACSDCTNISYNANHDNFRFSLYEGGNPTASVLDAKSLKFICFSSGDRGSIFNVIMLKKKKTFPEAVKWAARALKMDENELNRPTKLPFDGFYKDLRRGQNDLEWNMKTYPVEILREFGHVNTLAFLKDGINLKIQERFELGYDIQTDRITIPQWNINGELVGVMGRSNDPNIPHNQRWLPIIPCSRSHTL